MSKNKKNIDNLNEGELTQLFSESGKTLAESIETPAELVETSAESIETSAESIETSAESNQNETSPVSFEKIESLLTQPDNKKRRGRKKGWKKEQSEDEKKAEVKQILQASFCYAIIGLTKSLSLLLKNDKWSITDENEAQALSAATIQYLELRFPDWQKASPELNLILAWSSYFIQRI